jgi:hypothetical protein
MTVEDNMGTDAIYHFDPVDIEAIRLTARLSVGARVRRLLGARQLAVALIRGRLTKQYPNLSAHEINLKVLEEIERAERAYSRPYIVP